MGNAAPQTGLSWPAFKAVSNFSPTHKLIGASRHKKWGNSPEVQPLSGTGDFGKLGEVTGFPSVRFGFWRFLVRLDALNHLLRRAEATCNAPSPLLPLPYLPAPSAATLCFPPMTIPVATPCMFLQDCSGGHVQRQAVEMELPFTDHILLVRVRIRNVKDLNRGKPTPSIDRYKVPDRRSLITESQLWPCSQDMLGSVTL